MQRKLIWIEYNRNGAPKLFWDFNSPLTISSKAQLFGLVPQIRKGHMIPVYSHASVFGLVYLLKFSNVNIF